MLWHLWQTTDGDCQWWTFSSHDIPVLYNYEDIDSSTVAICYSAAAMSEYKCNCYFIICQQFSGFSGKTSNASNSRNFTSSKINHPTV